MDETRINPKDFDRLLCWHRGYRGINTFIETGTNTGSQTILAARFFNKVHTIELNKYYYNKARRSFNGYSIKTHLGDSVKVLPKILKKADPPFVFFLDAHFSTIYKRLEKSPFPLFEELEIIKNTPGKNIVIIDDVHNFGVKREELKLDENVKEWERVTQENLINFFGERIKDSQTIDDYFVMWLKAK